MRNKTRSRLFLALAVVSLSVLAISSFSYTKTFAITNKRSAEYASGTWTDPVGVTVINVQVWGAGGGGASCGGAGAGGYISANLKVTPGTVYAVEVGGGGAGGPSIRAASGAAGGQTSFGGTTGLELVAYGGKGGKFKAGGTGGFYSTIGSPNTITSVIARAGGKGGRAYTAGKSCSGGGGAGTGSSEANGMNGTNSISLRENALGGIVGGGRGGTYHQPGQNATATGGGGGGGGYNGYNGNAHGGGNGAHGFEIITWNGPATVIFNANGGSGSMPNELNNQPADLTANAFTWTGYNFTGWNTASNGSGTAYANQAIYDFTASTTLYAQWAM